LGTPALQRQKEQERLILEEQVFIKQRQSERETKEKGDVVKNMQNDSRERAIASSDKRAIASSDKRAIASSDKRDLVSSAKQRDNVVIVNALSPSQHERDDISSSEEQLELLKKSPSSSFEEIDDPQNKTSTLPSDE